MDPRFNRRTILTGSAALGAISLGGAAIAHAGTTTRAVELPLIGPVAEDQLHVLTYNLRTDVDDGDRAWDSRLPHISTLLEEEQPTIFGTQEGRPHQIDDLIAGLADYKCVSLGREEDGSGESCAIFYRSDRLEERDNGHLWLSETPDVPGSISWGAGYPRMMTWIEFFDLTTEEGFIHINTHFDNESAEAREKSAAMVRDWIQDSGLPCLLTGDFNDVPGSEPYDILITDQLDTWDNASELLTPQYGTHNDWEPVPEEGGDRIDWILSTAHFTVHKAAINTWTPDGETVPSDHWPLQTVVSL